MADVQPFRAVRYAGAAGPLADLVAPPVRRRTDERARGAVHAEPVQRRARDPARVRRERARACTATGSPRAILERDDEEAVWLSREDFVGPDGVARRAPRRRRSARAEPYERGTVLPHERTHPADHRGAAALCFERRVSSPSRSSCSRTRRSSRRFPRRGPTSRSTARGSGGSEPDAADGLRDAELLIADGHHRYESAVALGRGARAPVRIMALIVPTDDPGLQRLPDASHLLGPSGPRRAAEGEAALEPGTALARLEDAAYERAAAVRYRRCSVGLVIRTTKASSTSSSSIATGSTASATRLASRRRSPRSTAARRTSPSSCASRGSRTSSPRRAAASAMPPKSTYFFPKPLSGLLFPSGDAVTPWLETCRLCVEDIRGVLQRLPTRAEREPVLAARRGRGRHDRDRPGGRGRGRRASRRARRGLRARLRGARRADVRRGRPAPHRRRPDRRLGEREARDPVLLILARRRRRADDG